MLNPLENLRQTHRVADVKNCAAVAILRELIIAVARETDDPEQFVRNLQSAATEKILNGDMPLEAKLQGGRADHARHLVGAWLADVQESLRATGPAPGRR